MRIQTPLILCGLGLSLGIACADDGTITASTGNGNTGGTGGTAGTAPFDASNQGGANSTGGASTLFGGNGGQISTFGGNGGGTTIPDSSIGTGGNGGTDAGPAAVCGDGLTAASELCDDGNILDDDGCSSRCVPEPGFTCRVQYSKDYCNEDQARHTSCVLTANCGDGFINTSETGSSAGDGGVDAGDLDSGSDSGDGGGADDFAGADETCDDENFADGDGCSAACQVEWGFKCDGDSDSDCYTTCGDCKLAGEETCEDDPPNAIGGDDCSATCQIEICGNLTLDVGESCENGLGDVEGCDADCNEEYGWECNSEAPSVCVVTCGNGTYEPGAEECDDGNDNDDDGCTACAIDFGYSCTGDGPAPTVCTPICGDGNVIGDEECDDSRRDDGDGCDQTCEEEANFRCNGEPSVCCRDEAVIITYDLTGTIVHVDENSNGNRACSVGESPPVSNPDWECPSIGGCGVSGEMRIRYELDDPGTGAMDGKVELLSYHLDWAYATENGGYTRSTEGWAEMGAVDGAVDRCQSTVLNLPDPDDDEPHSGHADASTYKHLTGTLSDGVITWDAAGASLHKFGETECSGIWLWCSGRPTEDHFFVQHFTKNFQLSADVTGAHDISLVGGGSQTLEYLEDDKRHVELHASVMNSGNFAAPACWCPL
ncbi:MAG: DUF4215 domain-containing protein [Polyangiaceae bacterium]|nr:DUF4215 domain-containing protein [Polyangiaceae bacterium]